MSFIGQCYVTNSIYIASLAEENTGNVHYKFALTLGSLSLLCVFLIAYSAIINLKYVMDHYKRHDSTFRMC